MALRYPKNLEDEVKQIKSDIRGNFTSANSRLANTVISPHVNIDKEGLHILDSNNDEILRLGLAPDGSNGLVAFDPVAAEWTTLNLAVLGLKADYVNDRDSRSANTFGDIGTYGPELVVTVGNTGRMIVTVSARMETTTPRGNASAIGGASMGFEIRNYNTNAVVLPAADGRSLTQSQRYDMTSGTANFELGGELGASYDYMVRSLTPGKYYVTAKYSSYFTANTSYFSARLLKAQPI